MAKDQNWDPTDQDTVCFGISLAKVCVEEMKPNCLGFFQTQASRFAYIVKTMHPSDFSPDFRGLPECMKAYLPNVTEETETVRETDTEEDVEFPNFNKLVDELILIKKLLNKP